MHENKKLIDSIFKQARKSNGRKKLTCAQAFELAREFEAEIPEIGRICNKHNIKICKCQLGCFD
jgi:hypothetical protein